MVFRMPEYSYHHEIIERAAKKLKARNLHGIRVVRAQEPAIARWFEGHTKKARLAADNNSVQFLTETLPVAFLSGDGQRVKKGGVSRS